MLKFHISFFAYNFFWFSLWAVLHYYDQFVNPYVVFTGLTFQLIFSFVLLLGKVLK